MGTLLSKSLAALALPWALPSWYYRRDGRVKGESECEAKMRGTIRVASEMLRLYFQKDIEANLNNHMNRKAKSSSVCATHSKGRSPSPLRAIRSQAIPWTSNSPLQLLGNASFIFSLRRGTGF